MLKNLNKILKFILSFKLGCGCSGCKMNTRKCSGKCSGKCYNGCLSNK